MSKKILTKNEIQLLAEYGLKASDYIHPTGFIFKPGEFFLREGEPIQYLYFITAGKAKICLNSPNGKQLLLCYVISNGLLGDLELMTNKSQSFATAQAISELHCLALPILPNESLLKNNLNFLNHIGSELANKLVGCNTNSTITALHPLEERLCSYILKTAINGIFNEKLTDVAGLLGASYRHLLRCLDKLCRDEVLMKQKKGFLIKNEIKLTQLAADLYDLEK